MSDSKQSIGTTRVFAATTDIYVSASSGNDGNSGTMTAPLKTLAAAKDKVKALLPAATGPINVWVRAGAYYLSSALVFDPSDSGAATVPVTYSAYLGEKVVISGGVKLNPVWTTYSGNIMIATIGTNMEFDQLFLNGQRQILARYPKYNPNTAILGGYASDCLDPARVAVWSNPTTGLVRGLHDREWGGNSYKITDVSNGTPTLQWVGDNNRGSGLHPTYHMVENIFEELDAPGEWFYDKTQGKLYFYPPVGTDLSTAVIEIASIEELIKVVGTATSKVKYLTFAGFTYTQTYRTLFTRPYEGLLRGDWTVTRAGTVYIQDAENITIKDSKFDQVGGNGIFVSGYNRNHLITNNEFIDTGATAIQTVGLMSACRYPSTWSIHNTDIQDTTPGPLTSDYPSNIVISYNHSSNNGVFEKQTAGVNISMSDSITVSHNTIHSSPRAGINIDEGTFGGHIIEYNDIWDCVRETSDHGPINSWGRDRFWSYPEYDTNGEHGVEKRPYALLDVVKTNIIRNNRILHTSEWGIDLDDGSSNYDIYNNLLLNCGIKLREGFFRNVHNNILINGATHHHVSYAQSDDKINNNIIVSSQPYQFISVDLTAARTQFDYNLFWNFGSAITFPVSPWIQDVNTKTGDPLFTSPSINDYTVKTGSPALAVGFANFSMTSFGKPGAPQCLTVNYGGGGPGGTADGEPFMGATLTSIFSEGVRSSTGLPDMNGACLYDLPTNSYAYSQGFRQLDVIRQINSTTVTTKSSFWAVYNQIAPGSIINLQIFRNQALMNFSFVKA